MIVNFGSDDTDRWDSCHRTEHPELTISKARRITLRSIFIALYGYWYHLQRIRTIPINGCSALTAAGETAEECDWKLLASNRLRCIFTFWLPPSIGKKRQNTFVWSVEWFVIKFVWCNNWGVIFSFVIRHYNDEHSPSLGKALEWQNSNPARKVWRIK